MAKPAPPGGSETGYHLIQAAPDVMPTFFEAGGARVPDGYTADGVSLVPLLGGGSLRPRPLCWYVNKVSF